MLQHLLETRFKAEIFLLRSFRLCCDFISKCYPELPIPFDKQNMKLDSWDKKYCNWVPFFSTVMEVVYPTLKVALDEDATRFFPI